MEKRKLGQSGVEISVITFGAWAIGGWMWGGADRKEAIGAIRVSMEQGITSIDTAPAYGQGLSEEITGEAIRGFDRTKIQLLTKFGLNWHTHTGEFFFRSRDSQGNDLQIYKLASRESIMRECEDSLRRLGTDYIDLYQIHWPDATTPVSETMEAMERLLEQGKIKAAGVCNYSLPLLKEAEKVITLASNQIPYSMVNRNYEKEVIPYARKNHMAIIAYSPLQRGLLTGKMSPGYQFNEGDSRKGNPFFTDENIRRVNSFLDKLKPMAGEKHATPGQLVIRWTLEQPGITVALVGARNAKQALENARAWDIRLTEDDLGLINTELEKVRLTM
jgi:aryl-alcohol dehydrogenase-like predicted oxidoreductase